MKDRDFLDEARAGLSPTDTDRARVRAGLAAALGASAATASATASAAASGTALGAGAAAGTGIALAAKVALLTTVLAGVVGGGVLLQTRSSPSRGESVVLSAARDEERAVADTTEPAVAGAPVVAAPVAVAPVVAAPVAPPVALAPAAPVEASVATLPSPRAISHARLAPAAEQVDPLSAESALIERARSAIRRRDATSALQALDEHARRFPLGSLREERMAAHVRALCLAGQDARASEEATQFAASFPSSIHADAVARGCAP